MWRRIASILVGAALSAATIPTVCADETNVFEPLPHQLRWANVEIVQGRIRITASRYNQTKARSVADAEKGVSQQFSVSVSRATSSLRYERLENGDHLTVEILSDGSMQLHFAPGAQADAPPVQFTQPSYGSVTLVIGAEAAARQFKADGLWRLCLTAPDATRNHLIPLLETLRDDWNLTAAADRTEAELIASASSVVPIDRKAVAQLVGELGHLEFHRREDAHEQLLAMGQGVLIALEETDYAPLDAEQRRRIAEIRRTLSVAYGDVPARTATYLASDESVWLAIMSHENPVHRQLAARQLSFIRGHAVEFDPDGERVARRRQLEKLRNNTVRK